MSLYLVDFARLQRPEHAVVAMITGYVQNGDQWLVLGPLSTALQHVLDAANVAWEQWPGDGPLPAGAYDMTGQMIRITEIERGLARYTCETPYGVIAIASQNLRYQVLVTGQAYGVYATPREALAALLRPEAQRLPIGASQTLGDCQLPATLDQWTVTRLPESSTSSPLASGPDQGLTRAAQQAAARSVGACAVR
ncbi:hypothetical protein [Burkholderia pseudomallei]|uniref:hypothetical protein n=1 Tax=Burkholderia pseudomallei TaxID=28450 RepID=UPI000A1A1096|nr:hypothetical protein [Burkholderia pseudomallei]ARL04223.1 hypothetical protein BOC44_20815 [Burkholderia pseudomallei]